MATQAPHPPSLAPAAHTHQAAAPRQETQGVAGTQPQPAFMTPANLLALQRTIGNQAVQRILARGERLPTPPPTTSVSGAIQRKLGPYKTLNDVRKAIVQFITAKDMLEDSPEVQQFITDAIASPDKWERHKTGNPQERSTSPKGQGTVKIHETPAALAMWIVRLYTSFKSYSESGYDEKTHESRISETKPPGTNWEDFVTDRLHKLPLGPTINKNANPYKKLYDDAVQAAGALDKKETKTATIKIDLSVEFQAVRAYADFVKANRDLATTQTTPFVPVWTTEPKFGTGISVHAEFVPHMTMPRGSGQTIQTPIDWFYSGRTDEAGARYVKGHLLNDHVGGPAKNYNLSPLYARANTEHQAAIESYLKDAVAVMQYETSKGKPLSYSKAVYDVFLGPQRPRAATETWRKAAAACKDPSIQAYTLAQVKASTNAAHKELIEVISAYQLDDTALFKHIKDSLEFNALLWETEDYLVRDWYVRLLLEHPSGEQNILHVELHNTKPTRLGEGFKPLPRAGDEAGMKWSHVTTPIPATDTEMYSEQHPNRLMYALETMPREVYEHFKQYVEKNQAHLDAPEQITLPDWKAHLDLSTVVKVKTPRLVAVLKAYEKEAFPAMEQLRNKQATDELLQFTNAIWALPLAIAEGLQGRMVSVIPAFKDQLGVEQVKKLIVSYVIDETEPHARQEKLNYVQDQINRVERKQKTPPADPLQVITDLQQLAMQNEKLIKEIQPQLKTPHSSDIVNLVIALAKFGASPDQIESNVHKVLGSEQLAELQAFVDFLQGQQQSPSLAVGPSPKEQEESKGSGGLESTESAQLLEKCITYLKNRALEAAEGLNSQGQVIVYGILNLYIGRLEGVSMTGGLHRFAPKIMQEAEAKFKQAAASGNVLPSTQASKAAGERTKGKKRQREEGPTIEEVVEEEVPAQLLPPSQLTAVGVEHQGYQLSPAQRLTMSANNLETTGTIPDGDCAYKAFAETAGLAASVTDLKKACADIVEGNWDHQLMDLIVPNKHTVDRAALTKKIKEPGAFFGTHGEVALPLLSELSGFTISAIDVNGNEQTVWVPQSKPSAKTIRLVHVVGGIPHFYGTRTTIPSLTHPQ